MAIQYAPAGPRLAEAVKQATEAVKRSTGFLTNAEMRAELHRACSQAGGQSVFAAKHGVSAAFVSAVRSGKKPPGPKLLRAIGLVTETVYRRVEDDQLG